MSIMDGLNYEYIANRSRGFYHKFSSEIGSTAILSEKEQERIGFYFFILSHVCLELDFNKLAELIIDTRFNEIFFPSLKAPDYGIDAYFIGYNEGIPTIYLFNFKYRESYSHSGQSDVDLQRSQAFLDCIKSSNARALKHKSKSAYKEIKEAISSTTNAKVLLYYVSNESVKINNTHLLDNFKDSYDVEVVPITISDIADITSLRPKETINARLKIDESQFLKHIIRSEVSYQISIKVIELARITCNKVNLRNIEELKRSEDFEELYESQIENNILFDNVRGFLGKTNYNSNIEATLLNEPEYFFIYNNGITFIVDNVTETRSSMSDIQGFELINAQIVNGGQTLRTIHSFIKNNHENDNFNQIKNAYISVRIINVGRNREKIGRKVAEYTNSQNKILPIDLKSVAEEQFLIEKILKDSNIYFQRKRTIDISELEHEYDHSISLEKMGQILYSIQGNPHRATTGKSSIFDKEYESLFQSRRVDFTKCPEYVRKYYEIIAEYKGSTFLCSDQKVFYILYIIYNFSCDQRLKEIITKFEEAIASFKHKRTISDARKMLVKKFKDSIDIIFNS